MEVNAVLKSRSPMQSKSKSSYVVGSPRIDKHHTPALSKLPEESVRSVSQMEKNVLIEESIADIKEFGDKSEVARILDNVQMEDLVNKKHLEVSNE